MKIPQLDRSKRIREYNSRSFEEVSEIVGQWLFRDDVGHREMDTDILGLDPSSTAAQLRFRFRKTRIHH